MEKLNIEFVEQLHCEVMKIGAEEEKIYNRITDIHRTICKEFGDTLDTWYFYGAEEGEIGDLWGNLGDDSIDRMEVEIIMVPNKPSSDYSDYKIIDKHGKELDLSSSIPTRWLYEDFEKELSEGSKKYVQQKADKKRMAAERRLKKKEEKKILIEAAKKKLTKQELTALKLK
jgi:hypothetical protein